MGKNKTIKVNYLARVEGEGGLHISLKNGIITDLKLNIFESPRFFEAFLRGRQFSEAPDITARICGICPVAYQMSSVHAMENAFGIKIDGPIRELRRLLYCGEWIESHALHIYLLHLPDFLGYESAVHLAKENPEIVQKGLQLKKAGNEIVKCLGGREIHPINVKVGGFYKAPGKAELNSLIEPLQKAQETALDTIKLAAALTFPDCEYDYEFVALSHPEEYPLNEGRVVSSKGLDIPVREYENNFEEVHLSYSNALQSKIRGKGAYLVGPLARYNLNFEKLSPLAKKTAKEIGCSAPCNNPFKSIIVRSIETLYACEEALRIIKAYEDPEKPAIKIKPVSGIGYGCTEAPRGILYHRYKIGENGEILEAKIVPPTSQNQKSIEDDLRQVVTQNLNLPDDKLKWLCEQTVRNYDPCISCATHFLKLSVNRE